MPKTVKANSSQINQVQAKTCLLLVLWYLGADKAEVNKSQVTKRIVAKKHKVGDYQGIFEELEHQGAIAIAKNKFSLSPQGVEMLGEMLKQPEARFEGTIVGTWAANALLKWIAHLDSAVSTKVVTDKNETQAIAYGSSKLIASYEKFQPVALAVYEQLNQDYNLDHLVPIYRIRREIGNQVTRAQFNEWLLEMQADDFFQLQGGSVEDSAPDKIEDSITTEFDGLRCYARLLKS
ncbi:MAG: hypothetical protein F6K21_20495 [Symploca sp. SIO2D2]|nr:hypothetical protein [Symploca sp. SIO2D2]